MDKAVIRQATYLYQIIRKATNNEIEFYFNKIYSLEEMNGENSHNSGYLIRNYSIYGIVAHIDYFGKICIWSHSKGDILDKMVFLIQYHFW